MFSKNLVKIRSFSVNDFIRSGRTVIVFSAHAADFCSRAGGTILRFVRAGSSVHIVDFTFGERCESPALWETEPLPSIDEIKKIRASEISKAAAVLGATAECLDFGDCPLIIDSDRKAQVVDILRIRQPDLLLTHWKNDILHPDHCVATDAVIWASRYCFRPVVKGGLNPCPSPQVVFYETTLGTAPVATFVPTLFVDIGECYEAKCEALNQFAAQPGLAERYGILAKYRALEAQSTAWMKGCEHAEGFIPLYTQAAGFSGPLGFGA
ncbi:MAG: hypothetical protein CME10_00950 [Gemmatimonadetes bacterium]|nr:hypothetical protein [Gemmatimonadota bacterium]